MRFARTLPLLAAVALAAPLLSGCGAEKVAGVDVAKAAEATAAKGTARISIKVAISGLGLGSGLTITGKGVTALDRPAMDVTFDLSDLLGIAGIISGTDLKLRLDGATLYVDTPDIPTVDIPNGWMAVDLRRLVASFGIDPAAAAAMFTIDPASQLRVLRAAGRLEEVGHEKIDGVDTTHLKGAVKLADVIDALPDAQRAAAQKALDALAKLAPAAADTNRRTPIELWVDAHDVARRVRSSSTVPRAVGINPGTVTILYELSDFGAPLDVSRPDGAQDYTDKIIALLPHGQ
jgi:hypothetical protein